MLNIRAVDHNEFVDVGTFHTTFHMAKASLKSGPSNDTFELVSNDDIEAAKGSSRQTI